MKSLYVLIVLFFVCAFVSSRTLREINLNEIDTKNQLVIITLSDSTNWLYHEKYENLIDKKVADSLGLPCIVYNKICYTKYKDNLMIAIDLDMINENVYYNTGKKVVGVINGQFKLEEKEINTEKTNIKYIQ